MTYRRWFVMGTAFALLGVLVVTIAISYGSFSPRGFVEDHYQRAAAHDLGREARAYSSTKQPSQVAQELTDAWQPADQYIDSTGVYLRYDDDSVVIRPVDAGSLILLERLTTAYPRYHSVVGSHWGWGRGNTVRGGGPGSGK
ncbi:DUF4247 domain-containing protein [Salinispora oceanensis]|uniref:DUF4247 domain-containing protein n=1 Tax=Salinispora oceanensis TaxID=1050199 RepID=UPI0003734770|nr:DUF4247 domain-containing protein [Salinispora oceanensis]